MSVYEYPCEVRRVVDGDTLDLDIDLGLGIHAHERVRLLALDAPEINTAEGKLSKKFVEEWVRVSVERSKALTVRTVKDGADKYGRYLAVIYDTDASLNDDLLKHGYAKAYYGGKR